MIFLSKVTDTLTGSLYLSMLREGSARLADNRDAINSLNVFPIPDGDTGDNMFMTIDAGCSAAGGDGIGCIAASAAKGMLLGARGNSGVILSRIFSGISKVLDGEMSVGLDTFRKAMESGVHEAYSAVSVPVEGTILTVLRESVENAHGTDFESYFKSLTEEMQLSLDRTPELLDVLREACVVDSGGAGMLCIAQGMYDALNGIRTDTDGRQSDAHAKAACNLDDFGPDSNLVYGYCTEFLLRLQTAKVGDTEAFDPTPIKDFLESAGDSVVCFKDGSIVKAHVHTKKPGDILNKAQAWGEFLTVKIENMTLQHSGASGIAARKKKYGVVAVASGKGLSDAFREAGADEIVPGGQTMNPDAGSFIKAFDSIDAETIFVFPNNSNVVMTAQQAAGLYDKADVIVIPSKDPGSGYVAVASMDKSSTDAGSMASEAKAAVESTVTGMVAPAIRDAFTDGVEVHNGEFIGFGRGRIRTSSPSRLQAALQLAESLDIEGHDVAIIFFGKEVGEDEACQLASELDRKYPRTEIMVNAGGQPVYDYILTLC